MSDVNEALRKLYDRRHAKHEAKKRLEAIHNHDPETGIGEDCTRPDGAPCYTYNDDPYTKVEWCDFCKRRQPIWEEYQKASRMAAAALRRVLAIGRKLSREHDQVTA